MLSRQRFRPFLLLGVGVQRDDLEGPLGNSGDATSPYVTAGLGFQYQFNERWSMQADYRSVRGYIDEDRLRISRTNNKYLTIGVNYAFNPPPKPYVPPPPPPEPVAEPAPPPPPPPPPPPAKFEKITLKATELFGFNSAKLSMPQPSLDDIAAALTADPSITDVDIVGYTDRLGSAKYNLKLSQRRADAVREYLIGKGVDGKRLQAHGKGKENPVVECHNKKRADLIKCLEPNRRVEVEQITIERRVE
jgi:OOP family OmpA-OmpF porin